MNREAFAQKLCRMVLQCANAGWRSMPGATIMGKFQDGESLAKPARTRDMLEHQHFILAAILDAAL
jgi:hypothetical protein